MPVQNSNFKISARPDLATYLLQILIPAKSRIPHEGNNFSLATQASFVSDSSTVVYMGVSAKY